MDQVGNIVGLISGLIAIYSFITGVASLPDLRNQPKHSSGSLTPAAGLSRTRLLILIPVFVVSLIVTFLSGWAGSDSSGIMFTLLVLAGLSAFAYVSFLHRSMSQVMFALINIVGLTALGFAFGSITRGEEAIGLIMGMFAGIGVPIITRLSRPSIVQPAASQQNGSVSQSIQDERSYRESRSETDITQEEQTILRVAQQQKGEVRITDVALETKLSLDRGRDILEALTRRGYCHRAKTETGATIYRFPDLQP